MLTELLGKGGRVCQSAREGKQRCPLIVRPTSEDALTGNIFQALGAINARWWLPDMLNTALGARRFRKQVFRKLRIELWKNRPTYPRELLPWAEGSTQVDVSISWENPRTTVFVEMKYTADLASKTAGDNGQHGFPSDQLIRNARVGLLECGYFRRNELFHVAPRDFALILMGPTKGHDLVRRYRSPDEFTSAVPHSDKLCRLPRTPFIGELTFQDLGDTLRRNRRWLTRGEKVLVDNLIDYLAFKIRPVANSRPEKQTALPLA